MFLFLKSVLEFTDNICESAVIKTSQMTTSQVPLLILKLDPRFDTSSVMMETAETIPHNSKNFEISSYTRSFGKKLVKTHLKTGSNLFICKEKNVVNSSWVRNARLVRQCRSDVPGTFSTILEKSEESTKIDFDKQAIALQKDVFKRLRHGTDFGNGGFKTKDEEKVKGAEKIVSRKIKPLRPNKKSYRSSAIGCLSGRIEKSKNLKKIKKLVLFSNNHVETQRMRYIQTNCTSLQSFDQSDGSSTCSSSSPDVLDSVLSSSMSFSPLSSLESSHVLRESTVCPTIRSESFSSEGRPVVRGLVDIVLLRFVFGKSLWSRCVCVTCDECDVQEKYVLRKTDFFFTKVEKRGFYDSGCLSTFVSFGIFVRMFEVAKTFQKITTRPNEFQSPTSVEKKSLKRKRNQSMDHLGGSSLCSTLRCFQAESFENKKLISKVFNFFSFFLMSPMRIYVDSKKITFYDSFLMELTRRYAVFKSEVGKHSNCFDVSKTSEVISPNVEQSRRLVDPLSDGRTIEISKNVLDLKCVLSQFEKKKKQFELRSRVAREAETDNFLKNAGTDAEELIDSMKLALSLHKMFYLPSGACQIGNECDSISSELDISENLSDFPEICTGCRGKFCRISVEFETLKCTDPKSKDVFNQLLRRFVLGSQPEGNEENGNQETNRMDFKKESSVVVQLNYLDKMELMMMLTTTMKTEFLKNTSNKINKIQTTEQKPQVVDRNDFDHLFDDDDIDDKDGPWSGRCPVLKRGRNVALSMFGKYKTLNQKLDSFEKSFKIAIERIRNLFGFLLTSRENKILKCYLTDDNCSGRVDEYCKCVFDRIGILKSAIVSGSQSDNDFVGYDRHHFEVSKDLGMDPIYCMSKSDVFSEISTIFGV